MIRNKGILNICDGYAQTRELKDALNNLPDGEYGYLLFDKERNKVLPLLKYLFGIVLKTISDNLPDKPSADQLYRYFEDIYAPVRTCCINGQNFDYYDLKNESTKEVNDFIERVINHAKDEFGISTVIPKRDELKAPEAKEAYTDAYARTWENYSRKI